MRFWKLLGINTWEECRERCPACRGTFKGYEITTQRFGYHEECYWRSK